MVGNLENPVQYQGCPVGNTQNPAWNFSSGRPQQAGAPILSAFLSEARHKQACHAHTNTERACGKNCPMIQLFHFTSYKAFDLTRSLESIT